MENPYRWSGVAATVCAVSIGMTACSGSSNQTTGAEAGRAGAASTQAGAGAAAAGAGGVSQAGANHGAGSAAVAGQGGASGGTSGTAGSPIGGGGTAPTAAAGVGGVPDTGEGGSAGIVDTQCTLESLHLKVSGGATFERSAQPEDACGGDVSADKDLVLTFFVKPPELENTLLVSAIGHGIEPGKKGPFTPGFFSLATTGAIWDISLPDAEHPLACSVDVTTFEMVPTNRWRVAGSLSCPSPLSGIGPLGATPITIDDFKFSILFDATP
ncbi:MAG TPA: hypothetical protein VNG33_13825 [Polyangiaceae bacterium]|nr:hypothetical protein [Polyangiaceae bacterium]